MAFIETVETFAEDVKEKVGDKGFYLLLAAAAGFGVYCFVKAGNSGAADMAAPTTYVSYPAASENANVIMDSVNKQIESSQDTIILSMAEQLGLTQDEVLEALGHHSDTITGQLSNSTDSLLGALEDHNSNITEQITNTNNKMEEHFEATNNYIQEGIDAMTNLSEKVDDVAAKQQPVYVYKSSGGGGGGGYVATSPKPVTTTPEPTGPGATQNTNKTIKYTTQAGLNTSQSIVDALKAAGESSSFEDRANLYYANGGTGTYTGSSKQNIDMLNKLKEGNLQKAN